MDAHDGHEQHRVRDGRRQPPARARDRLLRLRRLRRLGGVSRPLRGARPRPRAVRLRARRARGADGLPARRPRARRRGRRRLALRLDPGRLGPARRRGRRGERVDRLERGDRLLRLARHRDLRHRRRGPLQRRHRRDRLPRVGVPDLAADRALRRQRRRRRLPRRLLRAGDDCRHPRARLRGRRRIGTAVPLRVERLAAPGARRLDRRPARRHAVHRVHQQGAGSRSGEVDRRRRFPRRVANRDQRRRHEP